MFRYVRTACAKVINLDPRLVISPLSDGGFRVTSNSEMALCKALSRIDSKMRDGAPFSMTTSLCDLTWFEVHPK